MALPEAGKWLETKPIRWAAGVRVRRGAAMEARAGRIPGLKAKRDILAASLSGNQLADMTASMGLMPVAGRLPPTASRNRWS